MTQDEIRIRVSVLHASINQLIAGNLTTGNTTAHERVDIAISALISALGESVIGLNVNPDGVIAQLREQIRKLTQ